MYKFKITTQDKITAKFCYNSHLQTQIYEASLNAQSELKKTIYLYPLNTDHKLKIQILLTMNITTAKCKNNDMYMQYLLYENKQMCSNIYK